MTKEEILNKYNWSSEYPNYMAEHEILEAMHEYAAQQSIAFADHLKKNYYFDPDKKLFHPSNFGRVYESEFKTIEALYSEFLNPTI
jgi:hypothetical protein